MTFFGHGFQLVVDIAHAPRPLTTPQFSMALYGAMNDRRSDLSV